MTHDWIAILDFGSQYTQLIARRVREQRVYCEILNHKTTAAMLAERKPKGIILSGGPASVLGGNSPSCDPALFGLGIPVLGVCYGMQLMGRDLGGQVKQGRAREYGPARIHVQESGLLFRTLPKELDVWMSHGDQVEVLPPGFRILARTGTCPIAAMADPARHLYGLQFHPEVVHTPDGPVILRHFVFDACGCRGDWRMSQFIEDSVKSIRERVGTDHVLCGLSGGVDSSVVAALLHRAIGPQLHCVFVDNGVLRFGEAEQVEDTFGKAFGMDLRVVRAQDLFLGRLAGVTEPEQKRKIIGSTFIDVFAEEARKLGDIRFLAQGTLYPDVIESSSPIGGPSATIKSHHNVGGLPEVMGLDVLEPIRYLFKDEVRKVASALGLPDGIVWRHPFPGPGLAIRITGEVTEETLETVRSADAIFLEELHRAGVYHEVWQAFAALAPGTRTVGVMGDARTYSHPVILRAVTSEDGMTADWARLPYDLLQRVSSRIANEVPGVNRVVYDISSKPPATIEWE